MIARPLAAMLALALALPLTAGRVAAETAALGGIATLELPEHGAHRPLDSESLQRARALRNAPRMLASGTVSDGVTSARWEFHRAGRFTEPGHEPLDMTALAERLQGAADDWTFAGWRIPPVFDREHHALFWAYDVKHPEGRRSLSFAAFLTREGVLLFQRTSENLGAFERDEAGFRRLLSSVRVNDGRRWEDFHAGDPLAVVGVSELVANRGVPPEGDATSRPSPGRNEKPGRPVITLKKANQWLMTGLLVVVGLRTLVLLARFLRTRRHSTEEIRMPPGAGGTSIPPPIEPEDPKRR